MPGKELLNHGPWCLHRTYLRKLRQLGMFVQLSAFTMLPYTLFIHVLRCSTAHFQSIFVHLCIHFGNIKCKLLLKILTKAQEHKLKAEREIIVQKTKCG